MLKRLNIKKEIFRWILPVFFAIFLSLFLKNYILVAAAVDGISMMPTLHNKDTIIVEKLSNLSNIYNRGEIVIFNSHNEKNDIFVKRIIAIEGDEIQLIKGKVFLNGSELKEPYLKTGTLTNNGTFLLENQKYKVEKGNLFVLGDNRSVSLDSRYLGPIKIQDIKGRVFLRTFPFDSIKGF